MTSPKMIRPLSHATIVTYSDLAMPPVPFRSRSVVIRLLKSCQTWRQRPVSDSYIIFERQTSLLPSLENRLTIYLIYCDFKDLHILLIPDALMSITIHPHPHPHSHPQQAVTRAMITQKSHDHPGYRS